MNISFLKKIYGAKIEGKKKSGKLICGNVIATNHFIVIYFGNVIATSQFVIFFLFILAMLLPQINLPLFLIPSILALQFFFRNDMFITFSQHVYKKS